MKYILILVPDDRLGGAEQYLKNIAYYYLKTKAEVHVVFLKKEISGHWKDIEKTGTVKFYYTRSKTELSGLKTTFFNLIKLRKTNFDFIYTSHVHLTSLIGLSIRCGLIKKKYFIARESTSIFRRFKGKKIIYYKFLYWIGYSKVDLLINQTELMRDQLVEGLPWIEKKTRIKVIPNPINLDAIQTTKLSRIKMHHRKYIVSAGRLIKLKGFDLLISAFREISLNYHELDLIILGEGEERKSIEKQIAFAGLQERIFLKGHVENVYDYFAQAEACIVSSRIEGFPNVLLQMMSQNHKVVSTKCAGGIDQLLGVISVDTDDDAAIRTGLQYALENDLNENKKIFQSLLQQRSLKKFQAKIHDILSNNV